jgi:hypothetical protein
MKRLLAVLLASVSLTALADTFAMPNQAGGEIVLSDRACSDKKGKGLSEAYNYSSGGRYMEGCWTVIDGMVHVVWFDGTRYTYSIDSFYKKSGGKKGTGI